MHCPLCAGPLHIEDPEAFVYERGHKLAADELNKAASARAVTALWMAIDALEAQADAIRTLVARGDGIASSELAEAADKDAQILRRIAEARPEVLDPRDPDDASEAQP